MSTLDTTPHAFNDPNWRLYSIFKSRAYVEKINLLEKRIDDLGISEK